MNTAERVARYIEEQKAKGIPLMDVAWGAAYACLGWAYVYGARGEYCDPTNRRSRASSAHPTIESKCRNFKGKDDDPSGCVGCQWFLGSADSDESKHEGRTRFFDCRGFTYWILLHVYGWKLQGAGATTQWSTAANWKSKGTIDSMPKDTLCCLFVKKGSKMEHTGFGYNDATIECSSGVQYFAKRKAKWTHWAIPACVDGVQAPTDVPASGSKKPILKKGDKGEYVTLAQTELINKGYSLGKWGADGSFGNATEEAVKLFQKNMGLTADGIIGQQTWQALDGKTEEAALYTVTIPYLPYYKAEALVKQYAGASMTKEGGDTNG